MLNVSKSLAAVVVFALVGLFASSAQAQITISPADGKVKLGGKIEVKNDSTREIYVKVCLGEGEILLGIIPAGGSDSWDIPDHPSLVGLTGTLKIYDKHGLLIEKEITIVP